MREEFKAIQIKVIANAFLVSPIVDGKTDVDEVRSFRNLSELYEWIENIQ